MKKNIAKLFFISLLKSLLCIGIIIGVGFASYKISYALLLKANPKVDRNAEEIKDIMDKAKTDKISKNLIFVENSNNVITHIMLEICNTENNNMDYITIPVTTDYTIPSTMYRKLCQVNSEIPQVVRFSKLRQYFTEEKDAYGYSSLIFEKLLDTDISYYTVISDEIYKKDYEAKMVTVSYKITTTGTTTAAGVTSTTPGTSVVNTKMNISVLNDTYKSQLKNLANNESKMGTYIKEQYKQVSSNLTVYNKIGYIEAYKKMDTDMFHYWGIPGKYNKKVFTVATKTARKALKALEQSTVTYTAAQNLNEKNIMSTAVSTSTKSTSGTSTVATKKPAIKKKAVTSTATPQVATSKGKKICVLNGSQIAGLASSAQKKLVAAGYTVPKVGNYTAKTLIRTQIIVKSRNQGTDLKQYFSNPEIVVGNVMAGYDIEIIIGTSDAN